MNRLIALLLFLVLNGRNGRANDDCTCGEANNGGRIINGHKVPAHKYPWMAALFVEDVNFNCGGSVITDRNIISAGHCVFYVVPHKVSCVVGLSEVDVNLGQRYEAIKYFLHPKFANSSFFDDYDISIVKVNKPIVFSFKVSPICLPDPNTKYEDLSATVAGWGRTEEGNPQSLAKILMETRVHVYSQNDCREKLEEFLGRYNDPSMVCAYQHRSDACQGDSGGPLFVNVNQNRNVLIGVVSFGDGCGRDLPGVYARINTHETMKWIKAVVRTSEGHFCPNSLEEDRRSFYSPYPIEPKVIYLGK